MVRSCLRLPAFLCAAGLTLALLAGTVTAPAQAGERFIILASTTSTDNSGLFAHLLPSFTAKTGIEIRVVALGTGQALRLAERGDADVLLVHHRPSEDRFVAEGYGRGRHDVMYNDFVILGPKSDPAGIAGLTDAPEAFSRIAASQATFLSRGDDSGTHKKERALWQEAGIEIAGQSGTWYRETGSGMGATLNTTAALNGYVLSDRATWTAFRNKGDLEILAQDDARLFNPYGVILVSPERHPHVKAAEGQAFIDWLISPEGQARIAAFKVEGLQLFFPSAGSGS